MKINEGCLLVTGGASGLGWGVVEHFHTLKTKIAVLDLPKEGHQEKIHSLGENIKFFACDITDAKAVEAALEKISQSLGSIRAAINCAGVATACKTLSVDQIHPLDIFELTLKVNLVGTFNLCRLVAGRMAKLEPLENGERGVLINTASIAAYDGQKGQVAYAASKGALVAMTLPMARDLAKFGIRVVTIAPGIFDTPMLAQLPEAARQELSRQIPFPNRLGKPKEYALLAQQIIENPMLNGETIRLDGALRMG